MSCYNCKYWDKELDEYPCNKCIHNALDYYKPITNYERIKAMSIEELAEFIAGVYNEEEDNAKFINGTTIPDYNEDNIKEWLEREAD